MLQKREQDRLKVRQHILMSKYLITVHWNLRLEDFAKN